MRAGNPGEVPCRKSLKQSPTPAAEPDLTGPEKIRPPGTGRSSSTPPASQGSPAG
jgi:hypothetical protein